MKARYLLPLGIAALALTAPSLRAQNLSYEVVDTLESMSTNWVATFNTNIVNTSKQKLTFTVARTTNDLPSDWQSWICTTVCFDSSVSNPPAVTVDPGKSITCELSIMSGSAIGDGRVTLQFNQVGSLINTLRQTFTASVVPSAVHQEQAPSNALRLPYPNPTANLLMVPIGNEHRSPASASLRIFDPTGTLVGDFTAEARAAALAGEDVLAIDLSAYPTGTYLYQLAIDGHAAATSFVVAR